MYARLLFLALLLTCCSAPDSRAQVQQLLPVDEADADPSFFLFRARLIETVAARNAEDLLEHVSPDVRVSFGSNNGIEGFRGMWEPAQPDSPVWTVLARVLSRGGTFEANPATGDSLFRFTAPYTFSAFPSEVDAFTHEVVLGERVNVRAGPGLDHQVIASLSYDVVEVDVSQSGAEEPPDGWRRVVLQNDVAGYVSDAFLASSIDYRAGFEKRDGRWMMVYFVAGD